jgi:hypothetical protein
MAIRINGQEAGPIRFTDDRPGTTIHIGPYLPTTAADGDVWIDSDTQNNAGKNLLQTLNLATIVGRTVSLSVNANYKDLYIVIRGLVLSTDADLLVRCNNDVTSYIDSSGVSSTEIVKLAGIKGGITTNKYSLTFEDTQDSQGFSTCLAQGVYRAVNNSIVPVLRAGVWLQVQPISSIQLTITAGGFTAGTVLVFGVN